ncbi:hypothetical protein PS1_009169 [Malus domestica]
MYGSVGLHGGDVERRRILSFRLNLRLQELGINGISPDLSCKGRDFRDGFVMVQDGFQDGFSKWIITEEVSWWGIITGERELSKGELETGGDGVGRGEELDLSDLGVADCEGRPSRVHLGIYGCVLRVLGGGKSGFGVQREKLGGLDRCI